MKHTHVQSLTLIGRCTYHKSVVAYRVSVNTNCNNTTSRYAMAHVSTRKEESTDIPMVIVRTCDAQGRQQSMTTYLVKEDVELHRYVGQL